MRDNEGDFYGMLVSLMFSVVKLGAAVRQGGTQRNYRSVCLVLDSSSHITCLLTFNRRVSAIILEESFRRLPSPSQG